MAWPKGKPRDPANRGGRAAGTPNKRTQHAAEILGDLGCDPLRRMAEIAESAETPLDLRCKLYTDLAQYVHPRRKAVEHSGPDGDAMQHSITVEFVEGA